jgi:hypothetical protein
MSDLPEFKRYVTHKAEERRHQLGPWHWAPFGDGTPAHEAICEDCGGKAHIVWDCEVLMWLADGDLIVMDCVEVIAWDARGGKPPED